MCIPPAAADSTDGNKEPVQEWEAYAGLMAHSIGKSLNAETFIECEPEDVEIRHEQGPVMIGHIHAGTFRDSLHALDNGAKILPEKRLENPGEPMDHLGVAILQVVDIRWLQEKPHNIHTLQILFQLITFC